jgi:hypothetical protein
VQDLYGLKSAGMALRNHLAECMNTMGWNPCRADRDLWMKAETWHDDGVFYWTHMLVYVDDILCMQHDHGTPFTSWMSI